jgi:hypoxanthine phosphoribosyltransferase
MKLGLSLGPRLELKQELKQELKLKQKLTLEQRLALKLKQELKLSLSLKQCLKLVHKLMPYLNLSLGPKLENYLGNIIKTNSYVRDNLPSYLMKNPSPNELQRSFPELSPLFNHYFKSQPSYGSSLRRGMIRAHQGLSLSLSLSQKLKLSLPHSNWSLVEAYDIEGDSGCKLPKDKIDFGDISLEQKLKIIDQKNSLFRFSYTQKGEQLFKVPLVRNINVEIEDIAIEISDEEYKQANKVLHEAGLVQRIVRAVPYSEIRDSVEAYFDKNNIDLEDLVIIGIDRGGRLPTHIMRACFGMEAYFLKVDQGGQKIDENRLENMIDKGILKDRFILFVDSTVDSGRQISALARYFDNKTLKHKGWVVAGSNEFGETLDNHINIDWGLDPDQSFEDNPRLMGVDYKTNSTIRANGNKMSTFLRNSLIEVSRGIILQYDELSHQINKESSKPLQITESKELMNDYKTLLIVGDGNSVTIPEEIATKIALKIENNFYVIAGTPNGNPGNLLNLVSKYNGKPGVKLFQPVYSKGVVDTKGYTTIYTGDTKSEFRDDLIANADLVLAIGGNNGTWNEVQRAILANKPTFLVRDFGVAGEYACEISDSNLHILENLEDVAGIISDYKK